VNLASTVTRTARANGGAAALRLGDRVTLCAVDADQPPYAGTAEILTRLSDLALIREQT
jgi:hypothetical protein